jgi:hypothetical protein
MHPIPLGLGGITLILCGDFPHMGWHPSRVTVLFDSTLQHLGWNGPTFAAGGWEDWSPPLVTGLVARSFWAQSLNGVAVDQAAALVEGDGTPSSAKWFNVHTNGVLSGPIPQPNYLVTPNSRISTYLRVPHSNDPILWRIVVSDQDVTPAPSEPPCRYGTEPMPNAPLNILVTADLIQTVLTAVSAVELAVLFVPIIGLNLAIGSLCSSRPPAFPQLSPDPGLNSLGDLIQAFQAISWSIYCRCVPGTPPPLNFPPPSVVIPPGVPAIPTFPCDPADLCASIAAIRQAVFALTVAFAETKELVTLLQRYSLPFAYAPGALHFTLSGEGSFAISRLLGFKVDVTTRPPGKPVLPGNPDYLWDVGWLSVSDGGGMLQEQRITRDSMTWLPKACQEATLLGYSLNPGVVIDIRELQAER